MSSVMVSSEMHKFLALNIVDMVSHSCSSYIKVHFVIDSGNVLKTKSLLYRLIDKSHILEITLRKLIPKILRR